MPNGNSQQKVPQTLASTTSKQRLNREEWVALLRVRTECPEGAKVR